jgi:hypothetical protein
MKFHYVAIALLILCQIQVVGQTKLTGVLIDAQTNSPVDFATIYINGTTNGTISDTTGFFKLENVKIPCQLIVSHIGYITQSVSLNNSIPQLLNLSLTPREIVVDEVKVSDKNLRGFNLSSFKQYFLGTDVWGRNAEIENEDAIIFTRDYQTNFLKYKNKALRDLIENHSEDFQSKKYSPDINRIEKITEIENEDVIIFKGDYESTSLSPDNKPLSPLAENKSTEFRWNGDSTLVAYNMAINLKAYSREPLIVNVPLLGYNLYVNLIHFIVKFNQSSKFDESSILGTYYFQSIKPESKRDSIRINKNRLKAYYNSSFHFCRSLYEKSLKKNGYRVFEDVTNKTDSKIKLKDFNLDSCLIFKGNQAGIIGLKERRFFIFYYPYSNGNPVDLTQKKGGKPVQSELLFLDDTCIIRKDGTTPGNALVFGPFIGTKKIGAMLPDNYEPAK